METGASKTTLVTPKLAQTGGQVRLTIQKHLKINIYKHPNLAPDSP